MKSPIHKHKDSAIQAEFVNLYKIISSQNNSIEKLEKEIKLLKESANA